MENNKQNTKIILYPILYWVIFIIIPFIIVYNMKDYNKALNIPGIIMLYIIFIAPFLFIIPYELVKPIKTRQKFIFISAGLVIPYVIFYIYIIVNIINNLHNSNFPF
ncbi:MAG: hypothetical protein HYV53_02265 [Parcubacteria group bacterium]|nr:hypothetical protein [Parcubacteria group bacterium]